MSDYPEKLTTLLDTLASIQDRNDRIQALIGIAERFKKVKVPESVASRPYPEDHKVPGCESQAYVWALERPDNTLKYYFAVENPQGISAMATAVILDETLSGAPLEQIVRVPQDVIYTIFGNELSMGKSMGLMNLMGMVQHYAKQHLPPSAGSAPGVA